MAEVTSGPVISVFIASPGDLVEERRRTRVVIDELIRSLGRAFGIHLVGWKVGEQGYGLEVFAGDHRAKLSRIGSLC